MARQDEMEAQAEFHAHEMAVDTPAGQAWERWLADVERRCRAMGLDVRTDMDGDGRPGGDGYSLDQCYDWFRAGWRPMMASQQVRWDIAKAAGQ